MLNKQSNLFILSGPSGVGKTSLFKLLQEKDSRIRKTISLTTRKPREGEIYGQDYFFVSEDDFIKFKDSNSLIEWNNRGGFFYGTLLSQITSSKVEFIFLIIDTTGAINLFSKIDAVSVFIMPPSIEELEIRLRNRQTESEKDIAFRMSLVKSEIEKSSLYDHILVCNDLVDCCENLYEIVLKSS